MNEALHTELLDLAREAAHRAGALLRDGRPTDLGVAATKSSSIDVVTEMDIAAEKLIVDFLSERRPADTFLAEEGSTGRARPEGTPDEGVRWVVDPLDGTVNYLYGLPSWAVSIAAEVDGEVVVGVVEVPTRGETFHAVRGRGAWLGERRLACRPAPPLAQALVGTGFSYLAERRELQARVVEQLITRVRDIRRSGSAAIDLCDVGAGRMDAFYERGLKPWDYAAGELVVREAGGSTGGRPGEPLGPELAVAGSPGVFAELQPLLAEFGAVET